jgi:hypothetical protein
MFQHRFWDKVQIGNPNECWPWLACKNNWGYGVFVIDKKQYGAHRFSWMLANEQDIPTGMQVCHSCDNPACVNPAHLWLGTHSDNVADKVLKGRTTKGRPTTFGENHGRAKLDNQDVREIRELLSTGELSKRAIAAKYGVSDTIVRKIANGTLWKSA